MELNVFKSTHAAMPPRGAIFEPLGRSARLDRQPTED